MNDPDEIYELKDSEGDQYYSYIKTFEKMVKVFITSVSVLKIFQRKSLKVMELLSSCISPNK